MQQRVCALAFVLVVVPACVSNPEPTGAPPPPPAQDAGTEPFPDTIARCPTESFSEDPLPQSRGFAIGPSELQLGELVRRGQPLRQRLYIPTEVWGRDVNHSLWFDNNAGLVKPGTFSELLEGRQGDTPSFAHLIDRRSSVEAIEKYVDAARRADSVTDVAQRVTLQQELLEVSMRTRSAADPAPTLEAGDRFVDGLYALRIMDATVVLRFAEQSACHKANLGRLMYPSSNRPWQFTLGDLSSAANKDPMVARYLRERAPESTQMVVWLETNPATTPPPPACTLRDIATCGPALLAWLRQRAEAGNDAVRTMTHEALLSPASIPKGFTLGRVSTSDIPTR